MMQDRKGKRAVSGTGKPPQKADIVGQAMRETFDRLSQEPLPKRLSDLMDALKKKEQQNSRDKSD
ncbi:MAG: hypothetical protein GYB49_13020 [Alphaproteobacteria bacterium]|nr:hypothetical protein [Hyphomonas sp.]MBR9808132.1 hypothetical protein [Alphaproteobacteria bacterium]|tara:strand:- start:5115 stop:5309 length:195 start_codon:yes stop_codon:yes gene_type:complete